MSLAENIAHALGNGKEKKNGGGWLTCCPAHGDAKPSLSITDSADGIAVHCHAGCGYQAVKDELRAKGLLPEREPANGQRRPLNGTASPAGGKDKDSNNLPAHIWSKSRRDADALEIIRKAFALRGIELEEIPLNMRLNEHKGQLSIVCAMRHPFAAEAAEAPEAVHLTLLDAEGRKCETRYQGAKKGLAVLLYNDSGSLVIGEGLETTLSAMLAMGYSGMVCGDAGNLAEMGNMHGKFSQVFVLVDSDTTFTGQRAALRAAERVRNSNKYMSVFLVVPDDSCFTDKPVEKDFNDLSAEAIQEQFKKAEQAGKAVLERLGGMVGHAKEQPDSPLPLIKKNELSEPFPFHVLGPVMAAACRDIQQAVQAPDALIAQCVLASANLAVQPLRDMHIDGRGFPLSLFLLTIAATGERKSAVDQVVLRPHREAEYQADKDMDSLCALYEMELAAWDKEKSVLINDGKRTAEEKQVTLEQLQRRKPKKPLDQKRLVSDFTFEGMYKLFQAGVPSKGLFADEGGQVTGGHGMRQETILATAAGLSKFWDGAPVDRIRVMDGASSLRGRRLAVHLMMQDKVGLDFFSNPILRDQGLGSRMLAAWPTSTAGGRAYSAVNALETAGVQQLHERIDVLLSQQAQYREESNKQELQPPAMTLSHEAKQAWVAFYNQVEAETGPKQTLEPVRGLANKAAEHAARIAGTVQLFENPAAVAVEEWAMQCGVEAAAWYLNEALRICGASNPAAHLLDAEKVLRWIHESGLKTVALPDMYQRGPVRSAGMAKKAVDTLKAHNHLLEPQLAAGEKKPPVICQSGKKSREWWEVHPESNSSFLAD
ncbi:DUF3987 domain-containing protein [Candidatus Electronema sp. PJ]|uniref:DUF3987 domain-containing protein n=1 Tax=Candidatus Electronema sp. PJ TaxID=3401572 RepID=UPI003AA8DABD